MDSLSVELGFRITIIIEIPDSLSWIPDFKAQDSGFQSPGFQIPRAKVSRILNDQLLVDNLYVVVEFYPWFEFYCLLFLDIVMYVNDFETKENII